MTLDRYPYGTTHELRGILARQSMADDIRSRHSPGKTACLYPKVASSVRSVTREQAWASLACDHKGRWRSWRRRHMGRA